MLIRISLIIAIIAGLAVGTGNFILVKEKITTLQANLKEQTDGRKRAEDDARKTHQELTKTTAELKTTKATLETTSAERDKAVAEAATQSKRADKLNDELTKTKKDRDDAQNELARYTGTGVKPEEIIAMNRQYKEIQKALDGSQEENKILGQELVKLKIRLKLYEDPEYVVSLPADLKGKVVVADPRFNFVVLNIGQEQGVQEQGELLVNRNGKLVAKVKVHSVQKDRCIANVMPGWQLGEVIEGDLVIPAHPAS